MGTTSSRQEKKSDAKKKATVLNSKVDELNVEHHDSGHKDGEERKEDNISEDQEEKEKVGKLFFGDARNAFMEGNRFVTR